MANGNWNENSNVFLCSTKRGPFPNLMKECSQTVYCESLEFICRPKTTSLGVSLNGYVGFDV